MTFEDATKLRDTFESLVRAASARMKAYPKNEIGLTPDNIKASADWKADKATFDYAMANLRAFNARYTKEYARELRAERRKKYA